MAAYMQPFESVLRMLVYSAVHPDRKVKSMTKANPKPSATKAGAKNLNVKTHIRAGGINLNHVELSLRGPR